MKKNLVFSLTLVLSFLMTSLVACGVMQVGLETAAATTPDTAPQATDQPEPATPTEPASSPAHQPTETGEAVLRVAYVKDENVWLWAQNLTSSALTTSGGVHDVRLSDDGQVVAFSRQIDEFHSELWAVNRDGSNERRLVSVEDLQALEVRNPSPNAQSIIPHHFEWVPGTHILAYNTQQIFQGPGVFLSDDLRLVNADDLSQSTLLPSGEGGEFYYSPDGSKIAVITPTLISIVQADGSSRFDMLIYERVLTYSEYEYYARPIWSSDSNYLRVAIPPAEALGEPPQLTTLWHIPADGQAAYDLGSLQAAPFFGGEVTFSPDLTRMLYLVETGAPQENLRELHVANAGGSGDLLFLTAPHMQLEGWAGSSTQFVFGLGDERSLQLGQAGGGYIPLTADPVNIANLRWLDGQYFLYVKAAPASWELRLERVGGDITRIDQGTGSLPQYDFVR